MTKKIKRIPKLFLTLILSLFIVSTSHNLVFAQKQESLKDIKNPTDNVTLSESEKVLKIYNNYELNDIYEKSKVLLESLNLSKNKLDKIELMKDINKNKEFYRVTSDTSIIDFDTNYELLNITNFSNTNFSGKDIKSTNYTNKEVIRNSISLYKDKLINSKSDLINITSKITRALNIPTDYELIFNEPYDDDFWQLVWQKKLSNNLFNPYESVKVIINRENGSIESLYKFNEKPNVINESIFEEEAIKLSKEILDRGNSKSEIKTKLTIFKPNYFWTNGKYTESNDVRLSWLIKSSDIDIYIDAVTGEILGGGYIQSNEEGAAFGAVNIQFAKYQCDLATNGMRRLGYNTRDPIVNCSGNAIGNFLAGSSSYALYIACHGSPTQLSDRGNWYLNRSDIHGNWHFVFLDACLTGVDNGWASSFKIEGYSGRGFLGWANEIESYYSYLFSDNFWPKVGSMPLRKAAIEAANAVPGAGTTPIRYYGDSAYYGWAW
ncbi:hypothetical protein [Clostridium algidicarnis]|uniref:hypothetical protein n=1 Tax=Clostridium algidicarnis TaxID=37659 RepID=UPI001C0C87D1|nr:hypothetical protein [Clostridium algidicarnis]MBU3193657.1 hypothetical protein [Clostridium algidicarnis]